MMRQEDLDAAVAEAIVTKAQAQALRDLAATRERHAMLCLVTRSGSASCVASTISSSPLGWSCSGPE